MLSASASEDEVHAAWLAAGANGDVDAMRQLRQRFPEFLDLERHVGALTVPSSATFCTWRGFHLRTLGASALHTSAWEGNPAIIQLLLESGQNPDARDGSGMTAIMVAILRLTVMTMRCVFQDGEAIRRNLVVDEQSERVDLVLSVIKLLLQFHADVDARSEDGKTALHCSTCDDAYDVSKFLLDAGASLDLQDESGKTPLHYCLQEEGLLVTALLLSRGANIDVENKDGVTPLALALQRANLNILQLFLNQHQCVVIPERRDFGAALLLQAVDCLSKEVVRFLVENAYAAVTVRNAKGETPMHRAIVRRDSSMMALLAGMDPEGDSLIAATEELETPAHYVTQFGSAQEVETLLQCLTTVFGDLQGLGAANPLNATDARGLTCLYFAGSAAGTGSHVRLDDGAANNVDARDEKVRLLLNHGARLFLVTFLVQDLASTSTSLSWSLPTQVKHCLRLWLVEEISRLDEPEGEEAAQADVEGNLAEALAELCMLWATNVACIGSWASLLPIFIGTGYVHDVVPLLVELPLGRSALPALLRQLEKFARHQLSHSLLLQLHDELLEACQAAMARST